MYAFEYHKPTSLAEATALLAKNADAKALAGGQTLLPTLKQRLASPSELIDLGGIAELKGIREDGDALVIGAMTIHAEVAHSDLMKRRIPGLASLAYRIGDGQVRNRGTIGGSVANNDPVADYPAAVLGLNATVQTNRRTIAADDFFRGLFETALEEGELITSIRFPVPQACAYAKFRNPASRYAVVGSMVARTAGGVRVAVTGASASGVFRWTALETALGGSFSADLAMSTPLPAVTLNSDIHASTEYRAQLVKVMTKRAIADCK